MAVRVSLEARRSPSSPGSSQFGRLKPRGLNVKASTQTQPGHCGSSATWPACGCRVVECPKHRGGEGVHEHLSLS